MILGLVCLIESKVIKKKKDEDSKVLKKKKEIERVDWEVEKKAYCTG